MWTRAELKTKAKAVLKVSYWKAFLVSLLIMVVGGNQSFPNFSWDFGGHKSGNISNHSGSFDSEIFLLIYGIIIAVVVVIILLVIAFRVFLGYPLEVGGRRYFIKAAQNEVDMNHIGYIFEKGKYLDTIKAMLWRLLINFLWYLLFIIPGIVKSYAYRFVPYILADNPNIGYKRALELSKKMTDGHKWKMFVLDLSFIGWFILGILALIVGVLFVFPYVNATWAELYLVLRKEAIDSGLTNHEELKLDAIN